MSDEIVERPVDLVPRKSHHRKTKYRHIDKKGIRERLKGEGRWTDFVNRREQLKGFGMTAEEAWKQAAVEFAPLPAVKWTEEMAGAGVLPANGLAILPAMTENLDAEFDWVASNIDAAKAENPPCRRAVNMLNWARTKAGRDRFWTMYMSRKLPKEPAREEKKPEKNLQDLTMTDLLDGMIDAKE